MAKRKKKKAEKRSDKNDNGNDKDVSSSDDDLPAVLSPNKRIKPSFQEGDLVFAKFKKFPFWPALFYRYDKTQKRGFVYFFEQSTFDNKTTLRVPVASIKQYSCEEKDDYISIGKSRYKEDYENGLARAHDYLQKRAMGKVPDFFADIQEEDLDEDDEEVESSQDILSSNSQQENNEHGDDEGEEEEKEPAMRRISIFKRNDRKSKRKQRKESKPYMDWIIANGKDYLRQLMEGKIKSERHQTFFRGSQKERDGLKYISGYGPISSDEEADKLLDMLTEWHVKEFAKESINTITYVTDVWLPEIIIASIKEVKNCSHDEAEKIFLKED